MSKIIDEYFELLSRELSDKSPEGVATMLHDLTGRGVLSDAIAGQVAQRFAAQSEKVTEALSEPTRQPARLEIDWGLKPNVGMELRPQFRLLTTRATCLDIVIVIDPRLEHEPNVASPPFRSPAPGVFEFYAAFRTMCQGQPCLPGQYTIDLFVLLQDLESTNHEVVYGSLLLNVTDTGSAAAPILEIVSGEQSLINLQGLEVERFAKVVARAETAGLINVVSRPSANPVNDRSSSESLPGQVATYTQHYQLKPISFNPKPLPQRLNGSDVPAIERAMLRFDNGDRWILIPLTTPEHRLKFGRDRWPNNDITLRHLPRTVANDAQTLQISRTHFRLGLDDQSVIITDHSANGLVVDGKAFNEYRIAGDSATGSEIRLELGGESSLPRLDLRLMVAANRVRDRHEAMLRMRFLAMLLGCADLPEVWRQSVSLGIDSVWIRRGNNTGEESYVVVLGHVDLAYDPLRQQLKFAANSTDSVARVVVARGRFWLENTGTICPIGVDDVDLAPQTIVGLRPGSQLRFGDVSASFETVVQVGLD